VAILNLIITDRCNRSCPYCFAQEKVRLSGSEAGARFLSLADLQYCIEFLRRSGSTELKLLGGEPTTHPEFSRFVEAGLQQGLVVTVFTNGLWSPQVTQFAEQCETPSLQFLFNINEPGVQPEAETARQAGSLRVAAGRGMIGFNIYRPDFDLRFVAGLIDRYGLRREVRLGVAHPIAGQQNEFVADGDLPRLGERLLDQLAELEKMNILGGIDCGFPLCMFPEQDLGRLVTCIRPGPLSVCQPVIDVGTDLTVWPCFPLSGLLNVSLRDFATMADLSRYYEGKLAALRSMGFMDRCLDCKYRLRGQCCGGCVARTLRNWERNGDAAVLEKFK
jgi:MoaA/NifB/PqqE/SkfB family radical SAM enzyme